MKNLESKINELCFDAIMDAGIICGILEFKPIKKNKIQAELVLNFSYVIDKSNKLIEQLLEKLPDDELEIQIIFLVNKLKKTELLLAGMLTSRGRDQFKIS